MTVCADPIVSAYPEAQAGLHRTGPAPIGPEDSANADVCPVTREHEDHLDRGAFLHPAKKNPYAVVTAPAFCESEWQLGGAAPRQLIKIDMREWHTPVPGLRVLPAAAAQVKFNAVSSSKSHVTARGKRYVCVSSRAFTKDVIHTEVRKKANQRLRIPGTGAVPGWLFIALAAK